MCFIERDSLSFNSQNDRTDKSEHYSENRSKTQNTRTAPSILQFRPCLKLGEVLGVEISAFFQRPAGAIRPVFSGEGTAVSFPDLPKCVLKWCDTMVSHQSIQLTSLDSTLTGLLRVSQIGECVFT